MGAVGRRHVSMATGVQSGVASANWDSMVNISGDGGDDLPLPDYSHLQPNRGGGRPAGGRPAQAPDPSPEEVMAQLRSEFDKADTDKSQALEPAELLAVFKLKFRGTDGAGIQEMIMDVIDECDDNEDGKLQFPEFVDMVHYGNFWKRFGFTFDNTAPVAKTALDISAGRNQRPGGSHTGATGAQGCAVSILW